MSTTAVIVLSAMARDEFERAWHGFEDPFDFIEGDMDTLEPVATFSVPLGDMTYTLAAADVASVCKSLLTDSREDVEAENEVDWDDEQIDAREAAGLFWRYLSEEEVDAEAWDRLERYWTDQLDSDVEYLAVFDAKLHWVVEAWKAMVADFSMIAERIPAMKPLLDEKLTEAHAEFLRLLDTAGVKAT